MKLLVLSDSHGHTEGVRRVLRMHTDADAVLFLGDVLSDVSEALAHRTPPIPLVAVRGNCDTARDTLSLPVPRLLEITLDERRLLLTHGDLLSVKSSRMHLIDQTRSAGVDIALFGHTHAPLSSYVDGERPLWLFNPGSLREGSFGLLTLSGSSVLFSHGQLSFGR